MRAQVLLAPEEAAKAAFTQSTSVKKITLSLNQEELTQVQKLAQTTISQKDFIFYEIFAGEKIIGHAGLISDAVRTKSQTTLVAIDLHGTIKGVEIIAFYEHPEYLPPKNWTRVFKDKKMSDPIKAGGDIPLITGSTLTTQKLAQATRIIRAVWQIKLRQKK